jgi:2-amino-4-hydroxy-6-hydroxymethyldihydropteridine diphosphokinase
VRAALGIGSNLGDSRAALDVAVARIIGDRHVGWVTRSHLYRTAPVGGPEQPDYLNAVVLVQARDEASALGFAEHLLDLGRRIEEELHRERTVRWGPRTIDVDVLAVGGLVNDDPRLTVPHPRLAERAFVLVPWAEVDPDFDVPGLGRVADLAARLPDTETSGVQRVS